MEYQIVVSPELDVHVDEFVSAWNETPECRAVAQASLSEVTPEGFPLDPGLLKEGLILLAGFAGGIALDVVKDLIKDRIKKLIEKKLAKKQESVEQKSLPAVEIVIIEQPGRPLIVVKEQE